MGCSDVLPPMRFLERLGGTGDEASEAPDLFARSAEGSPREMRGVWVTRWSYRSPEDLDRILDDCAEANLTHVFLQVRGRFDAFYDSALEPWASELTGTLGQDPGWDPLEHAIAGAHQRGLELHAWVNVYAMWQGRRDVRSVGVPHAMRAHPDWMIRDQRGRSASEKHSYQFASPGNPEVREHVVEVVADIGERYDVDGIHLDYLRYPGRTFGYDEASRQAAGDAPDFDDWRRQAIRETVRAMAARVDVALTGAVWGIYKDPWGWGVSGGYDNYFQDSYGMMADHSLEAVAPMTYWPVSSPGERLDFATLIEEHVRAAGSNGEVWAGIEANKLTWNQVVDCVDAARGAGATGVVLFEYKALRDKGWLERLPGELFYEPG